PTTSATRPPMPASTSSKIRPGFPAPLGRPSRPLPAASRTPKVSVLTASIIRDNSPPETMRASGRRSSPGFGETKNSATSIPSAERRAVFALQTIEQRQPVLDLLETRRRRLDAVGVSPQEQRKVFELRLDAVARVEVGLELRVERRQIRDAPPDVSKSGQDGA